MSFFKKILSCQRIRLYNGTSPHEASASRAGGTIEIVGPKMSGYLGNIIKPKTGTRLGGYAKVQHQQHISAYASAITTGVAVAAANSILAATALTVGPQSLIAGTDEMYDPDVPRKLSLVASTGTPGDASFTAATAKLVTLWGTNQFGESIVETVALNGSTPVNTLQCFATVTRIDLPGWKAQNDAITVGYVLTFAFDRPVDLAADLMAFARKASAATAFTYEALPSTLDVGSGYVASTSSSSLPALAAGAGATQDYIYYTAANLVGTMPSAPYLAEIIAQDGTLELVRVTAVTPNNPSTGITRLTIIRGIHGQTGRIKAVPPGAIINRRAAHSFVTTLTADDRLLMVYRTGAIA